MANNEASTPHAPWQVAAAFAAVYIIWGSTYLAIRFAIETIPPFLMAGARFLIAGALLYGWLWIRGVRAPSLANWKAATIVGGFLLMGGNGGVVWGEQRVPSSIAALLVAMVPIWMILLDWLQGGLKPGWRTISGLLLGFVGTAVLIGPWNIAGSERLDPLGAGVVLLASLLWATGSIYARRAQLPASPLQATAMEMLAGGALLVVAGLATGEAARLDWEGISLQSALAFGYLIVFGSLVAFSSYVWILRVSTPARVATYAYVNPVVAVLLGWAFAGEALTPRMAVAAMVIVTAVAIIINRRQSAPKAEPTEARQLAEGTMPASRASSG